MSEPVHVDDYTLRSARRRVGEWPTWPQALPGGRSGWLWRIIVVTTVTGFVLGGWAYYWGTKPRPECRGVKMEPGDVCRIRPYPKSRETVPHTYEEMASNGGHLIPWIALAVGVVIGVGVVAEMVRRAREVRLPTEAELAEFMQTYNDRCAHLQKVIDLLPADTSARPELAALRIAAAELAEQNGFRIDGATATLL